MQSLVMGIFPRTKSCIRQGPSVTNTSPILHCFWKVILLLKTNPATKLYFYDSPFVFHSGYFVFLSSFMGFRIFKWNVHKISCRTLCLSMITLVVNSQSFNTVECVWAVSTGNSYFGPIIIFFLIYNFNDFLYWRRLVLNFVIL